MARRRRGNGEGSVYQRADGKWCASLTVGYDENGKRRRRYLYCRTKTEVVERLADTRSKSISGSLPETSRISLGGFAQSWLDSDAARRVRFSTLCTYRVLVRRHIVPYLGGVRLTRLTPLHCHEWHRSLEEAGVSVRQREAAHTLLKTVLKSAFRLDLIARNPLEMVDKPGLPQKEVDVLDPEEIRALLKAASGHSLETLIVLAVATGARQGELFGLQWRDLDLERGVMTIQRTLVEAAGRIELGEPKTRQSRRRVDLPMNAVRTLREHRERLPATPHPTRLVFTDSTGQPLRKSNFIRRVWHPLLAKAGLRRIKFHSLRHSHATILLAANCNLKAVSERMGHSRTSMTTDVYAHAVEGMQSELVTKMERLFGG